MRIAGLTLVWLSVGLVVTVPAAFAAPQSIEATTEAARVAMSSDVRRLADWVMATRDNKDLPFLIVDKAEAMVFVFGPQGGINGAAPALLGLARGDDAAPGIGQLPLSAIRPQDRVTQAGRFEASLGEDYDQDVLWVDYESALSLHRVIAGNPKDRRRARLASPSPLDNRISFGCINVPAQFYDEIVAPAFKGTVGIVYILPETRSLEAVFTLRSSATAPAGH